jgi:hypothetical protein
MTGPPAQGPIARAYRKLFRAEDWNIGIVRRPIHAFLDPGFVPEIEWLPPPGSGKFRADPFGVIAAGRVYIMCEELDYRKGQGSISAIEFTSERLRSSPFPVIELPCHASYPYLVQHRGDIYCIPETCRAGEIAIYRADDFPVRWSRAAALVSGVAAADSTAFKYDGRWWLMCAGEGDGFNSRLLIWHAPDLLGPWTPHRLNPVKSDVSCTRPGGTPFVHSDALYRPAQDCSRTYGGRVVINRVTVLTPDAFREEQVAVVEPQAHGPYPHGMHTLSSAGEITLLDGKREHFIAEAAKWIIRDKAASLRRARP